MVSCRVSTCFRRSHRTLEHARAYEYIAGLLKDQGRLAEALEAYQEALVIVRHLSEGASPGDLRTPEDLMQAYNKIGDALKAQGDLDAALKAYQNALAIAEQLTRIASGNAGWQHQPAVVHWDVALVLAEQGQTQRALDTLQKGARHPRTLSSATTSIYSMRRLRS